MDCRPVGLCLVGRSITLLGRYDKYALDRAEVADAEIFVKTIVKEFF